MVRPPVRPPGTTPLPGTRPNKTGSLSDSPPPDNLPSRRPSTALRLASSLVTGLSSLASSRLGVFAGVAVTAGADAPTTLAVQENGSGATSPSGPNDEPTAADSDDGATGDHAVGRHDGSDSGWDGGGGDGDGRPAVIGTATPTAATPTGPAVGPRVTEAEGTSRTVVAGAVALALVVCGIRLQRRG